MNHHQYIKLKKKEIVDIAASMLNGTSDLIEGCRRLAKLRYEAGVQDDDLFLPIVAAESDTDHLPLGEYRAHCSIDYLAKADKEREQYIDAAREDIIKACSEIINKYIAYELL